MSDFPVHVIYIISDRYIYIHILDILFRLHYSDPLMPQEVFRYIKAQLDIHMYIRISLSIIHMTFLCSAFFVNMILPP